MVINENRTVGIKIFFTNLTDQVFRGNIRIFVTHYNIFVIYENVPRIGMIQITNIKVFI